MLKRLFFAASLACISLTNVVSAQQTPVVVELYTSQGCSSCPPADELLSKLGKRDNIIALALHVDYWDYIGWKDKFAHSAFTDRQRQYARKMNTRSIYTPQMIVNGVDNVVGNRAMEVADMVQAHATKGLPVPLRLSLSAGVLSMTAPAHDEGSADIILIRYIPEQEVSIPRGENAGRSLTYSNIVTEWRDVGDWDGDTALKANIEISGSAPVVVLVQGKDYGPMFAAARLR